LVGIASIDVAKPEKSGLDIATQRKNERTAANLALRERTVLLRSVEEGKND